MEDNFPNNDTETGKVLNAISKKDWFSVPEGYFDQLPTSIMAQINEAPLFHSIVKQEPVSIPEGYASQFETKIMAAIAQQKPEAKIVPMRTHLLRWTAVAAGLALVFTLGYMFMGNNQEADTNNFTAQEELPIDNNIAFKEYLAAEIAMDDLVAVYVAEQPADSISENSAVIDYLVAEDGLELDNL